MMNTADIEQLYEQTIYITTFKKDRQITFKKDIQITFTPFKIPIT